MITTNTSAHSARFIAMPILLFAVFAVTLIGIFTLARSRQVVSQPASSIPTGVETTRRNHRLLELNEGIKPVVTAIPFDRNKRLWN